MARKTKTADTLVAYKAFEADGACRGFHYVVGETYEHKGEVAMCDSGFHACTIPFDCWNYYAGHDKPVARVILAGVSPERREEDSKVVAARITIDARLALPDWIRAQVDTVLDLCKTAAGALASKRGENAAATGDSGHAAATGDRGHAAATGDSGHAAATGYSGHAAATGDSGHAAATGYRGHAAATGYRGRAAATGYSGHAAATGYSGHAAATDDRGHAAATGDRGRAAATGDRGHAAATGDRGHAAATGKHGIAASFGYAGTAMAGADGWVALAAWDDNFNLVCVKAAKVGGPEGIKAGVSYRLTVAGEFEAVR